MKRTHISYIGGKFVVTDGKDDRFPHHFPIGDNTKELGITHAVVAVHFARGPFIHRWQRKRVGVEERVESERMLLSAWYLYGSAVSEVQCIPI